MYVEIKIQTSDFLSRSHAHVHVGLPEVLPVGSLGEKSLNFAYPAVGRFFLNFSLQPASHKTALISAQ